MPGKSKKGKAKRYQQIKKTQNLQRQDIAAAPVTAAAVTPKPASPVQTKQPGKTAATTANALTNQYAYVPSDLRRIGILTGIVFVILIILYFIVS